ncbi:MAG: hypothetical protein KAK00_00085 [Nanoarchaeota archaeon]|nr:hypothetical protein [Nanoarchaeota archaeon]
MESIISKAYFLLIRLISNFKKTKNQEGYTILLFIPSDLKFMSFPILKHLRNSNLEGCKEILIILDNSKDKTTEIIKKYKFKLPIRIIKPKGLLHSIIKLSKSPYKFFWYQMITGMNKAKTKYVLLKGCNQYYKKEKAYLNYYKYILKNNLIISGIDYRNDIEKGIIGTSDMFIDLDIIKKSSQPIDLIPRKINNKDYDNMQYIQKKIAKLYGKYRMRLYEKNKDLMRMSYLIGTYRKIRNEKSNIDPNLRLWYLVIINESLKGTNWHDKEFISLKEYYKSFNIKINPIYNKTITKFIENTDYILKNIIKNNNLNKEIKKVRKEIK